MSRPQRLTNGCGLLAGTALIVAATPTASAQFVLDASRNATLYESPTGALANGAGDWFFIGMNNQGLRRRGLLQFDLTAFADSVAGQQIEIHGVSLRLTLTQGGGIPTEFSMHRLLADWGEGDSDAPGNEGGGTAATPGSATWLHTFSDTSFWSTPGGDFAAEASGLFVMNPPGTYVFSSEAFRDDVAAWLASPSDNFGWILVGDESQFGTARRFDSRRYGDPATRPLLEIDYSVVPAPGAIGLLALAGIRRSRRRG
jgi:hypothetical protein